MHKLRVARLLVMGGELFGVGEGCSKKALSFFGYVEYHPYVVSS
jgi:hypothetical protein